MEASNNAENVTAGKPKIGGAIFVAPVGTTLPESTSASLNTAFKNLGYISTDGVTNSNSMSSNDVKAWGGNTVLNTQTDKPDTFKFKLLEVLNVDVLKTVYGSSNVTENSASGEIEITANAEELTEMSWVIDMVLRKGTKKRIVIPSAKVSAIADIVYKDDDAVAYDTTISAVPDEDGNSHYEYIKKPATNQQPSTT